MQHQYGAATHHAGAGGPLVSPRGQLMVSPRSMAPVSPRGQVSQSAPPALNSNYRPQGSSAELIHSPHQQQPLIHNNASGQEVVRPDVAPGDNGPPRINIAFSNEDQNQIVRLTPRRKGKHDYAATKDKPFQFEDSSVDLEPMAIVVPPDDFLTAQPEPEEGALHAEFDTRKHEKEVNSIAINEPDYVPFVFRGPIQPLRPPDKIDDKEKITDLAAIAAKRSIQNCTFIRITTGPAKIKGLPKAISAYPNLTVLILRGIGLKKVDEFNCPALQYCDFSDNAIQDSKTMIAMLKRSPFMQILKMKGNPVVYKSTYRGKIIGNCGLYLKSLDDTSIAIEERMEAIAQWGPKNNTRSLGSMRWDLTFSATQEVKGMNKWRPELIVLLNLPKMNLSTINVAPLVNLEYLDLTKNSLKELRGLGLEKCTALQHLNLRNNLITENKSDLKVLSFLLSLRYLVLKGNPVSTHVNYRAMVIFFTRFLRGNNRTYGLLELDEQPITIDERITTLKTISGHNIDVEKWRWDYQRLQYFGLKQSSTKEFTYKIQNCILPKAKLAYVDLSPFRYLQYVDLSRNNLREVNGLVYLEKLRYLNLSENPRLRWQDIVHKDLKEINTLESLSFMVLSVPGHQCSPDNKKYRMTVLRDLLDQNHNLLVVDEMPISPSERVEAHKMMKRYKTEQVETYRFNLAVTIDATPSKGRRYHPTEVGVGQQYDPKSIFILSRLCSVGLYSFAVEFSPFPNLEEINLAKNKLNDITTIGLETLKKLRVLDVSYNVITGDPKKLAKFVDQLTTLECLAIRGNPAVKNWPEDRHKLIGALTCMKNVECKLQVIDFEVTIAERVEAWEKYSVPKSRLMGSKSRKGVSAKFEAEKHEKFKQDIIHFLRVPRGVDPAALTLLDLHDCGLAEFDTTPYPALEHLSLRNNHFKKLENIRGLKELNKLAVLDVRDNQFTKPEDFIVLIRQHLSASLVSLGLAGNKLASSKDYRAKFIKKIPELHERRFTLAFLDDQPITVDEICAAWRNTSKSVSAESKFFHVLTLRKIPGDTSFDTLKELDLSSCGLTVIELSRFPRVQKLSLKGNSLDGPALQKSQILSLQDLAELDVSGNNVQDFNILVEICRRARVLRSFYCDKNPCFPSNKQEVRIQFLSKLPQMRQLRCNLVLLNGFEIAIPERCLAVKDHFKEQTLDSFRMDLLFEKMRVDPADPRTTHAVTALNLTQFGLISLMRLRIFVGLVFLDVSFNNLRSLEPKFFSSVPHLQHLDIRENDLEEKGAKLLAVLASCQMLRSLSMKNSTADKEFTAKPKIYLRKVCSVLRQLVVLDGLQNPFNQIQPQHQQMPPPGFMPGMPFFGMPPPGELPPGAAEAFYAQQQQFYMGNPVGPYPPMQQQFMPGQYPQQQFGPPQSMQPSYPFPPLQLPPSDGAMAQSMQISPRHQITNSAPQQGQFGGATFTADNLATKKAKQMGVGVPGMSSELIRALPNAAPSTDTLRQGDAQAHAPWLLPIDAHGTDSESDSDSDSSEAESDSDTESDDLAPEKPPTSSDESDSESSRKSEHPERDNVSEDELSDYDNADDEPQQVTGPKVPPKVPTKRPKTGGMVGENSEFRKNPRFARLLHDISDDDSDEDVIPQNNKKEGEYWDDDSDGEPDTQSEAGQPSPRGKEAEKDKAKLDAGYATIDFGYD